MIENEASKTVGVSRRTLLKGTGVAATAAAASFVAAKVSEAQGTQEQRIYLPIVSNGNTNNSGANPPEIGEIPPVEVIALNRMAYGPRAGDVERVQQIGLPAYIEEQLNPTSTDPEAEAIINATTLRAGEENRPITYLNSSIAQLWPLLDSDNFNDRQQPFREVQAATWIRAVYSRWQLRERLVEFWHNHFNVNANAYGEIQATFPLYDRIMRENCLGNFRTFLEEIARSVGMQYYLDNRASRGTPPNENFVRELFELHTFGSIHYFNDLYDQWQQVPGALEGQPEGYIDEDVYEGARCFTGWTIASGQRLDGGERLPDTGEFIYVADWHDRFQKRVLATEIRRDQADLADGNQVLDLIAYHPATARYLCLKLCRRFVADSPPDSLVNGAVAVWIANQQAPDQIKQVVRFILQSEEFATSWGQKVKRSLDLFISFLRATNGQLDDVRDLEGRFTRTGYQLFRWPTPTGHPDEQSFWLSSSILVESWRLVQDVTNSFNDIASFDLEAETPPTVQTVRQIAEYWCQRMLGRTPSEALLNEAMDFLRQSYRADGPLTDRDLPPDGKNDDRDFRRDDYLRRLEFMIHIIAASPEFNWT